MRNWIINVLGGYTGDQITKLTSYYEKRIAAMRNDFYDKESGYQKQIVELKAKKTKPTPRKRK